MNTDIQNIFPFSHQVLNASCRNSVTDESEACKIYETAKKEEISNIQQVIDTLCELSDKYNYLNAKTRLGYLYYTDVRIHNNNTAIEWTAEAADEGDAIAQYNYAMCLKEGIGCKKNTATSFYWLYKSATQGLHIAQYELGNYYKQGIGCSKDGDLAQYWFTKAQKQ